MIEKTNDVCKFYGSSEFLCIMMTFLFGSKMWWNLPQFSGNFPEFSGFFPKKHRRRVVDSRAVCHTLSTSFNPSSHRSSPPSFSHRNICTNCANFIQQFCNSSRLTSFMLYKCFFVFVWFSWKFCTSDWLYFPKVFVVCMH